MSQNIGPLGTTDKFHREVQCAGRQNRWLKVKFSIFQLPKRTLPKRTSSHSRQGRARADTWPWRAFCDFENHKTFLDQTDRIEKCSNKTSDDDWF